MTYDPNNPNDPVRRVDPDGRRLENDPLLHQPAPDKKSTSSLPWLILIALLVVAGLIWMQTGTTPSDTATTNAPAPTSTNETTTQPAPPPATAPAPVPDTPAVKPPAPDAPAPAGGTAN